MISSSCSTRYPKSGAQLIGRFCLGCTPVVNLFPKTTEPIRLDHRKTAYRLIPDVRRERRPRSIRSSGVSASSSADDTTTTFEPFIRFIIAWRVGTTKPSGTPSGSLPAVRISGHGDVPVL